MTEIDDKDLEKLIKIAYVCIAEWGYDYGNREKMNFIKTLVIKFNISI